MRWTVAFPMFPADHLLPMARAAEAAGFDTITVPDSVFYPGEGVGRVPVLRRRRPVLGAARRRSSTRSSRSARWPRSPSASASSPTS